MTDVSGYEDDDEEDYDDWDAEDPAEMHGVYEALQAEVAPDDKEMQDNLNRDHKAFITWTESRFHLNALRKARSLHCLLQTLRLLSGCHVQGAL